MLNKKNVHEDVKFLTINIYHKVVQKNPQLKGLVKYNIGEEEYQIYQTNIYDTQKMIDRQKAKQEEAEKKKEKTDYVIDCIGDQ